MEVSKLPKEQVIDELNPLLELFAQSIIGGHEDVDGLYRNPEMADTAKAKPMLIWCKIVARLKKALISNESVEIKEHKRMTLFYVGNRVFIRVKKLNSSTKRSQNISTKQIKDLRAGKLTIPGTNPEATFIDLGYTENELGGLKAIYLACPGVSDNRWIHQVDHSIDNPYQVSFMQEVEEQNVTKRARIKVRKQEGSSNDIQASS